MKKFIQIILLLFFVVACAPKAAEEAPAADMVAFAEEDVALVKSETPDKLKPIEKKIIKNGRLGIKVKNLTLEKKYVDSLVRKYGAFYDQENLINNDYAVSFDLIIRIPNNYFEHFLNSIEKSGNEVSYKEIDAEDVTEQFVDLETRLTNKRKYMARYQDLLKSAKNVKEILEIQEKIRALEEEIESTTGRLRYLSNQVSYSTLELNITQKKEYKYTVQNRQSSFETFKKSFFTGWFSFVDFVFAIIENWMFILLISIFITVVIRYFKKRKSKKKKD